MTEQEKPDAIVRVNDYDVTLYRRGTGLEIVVDKSGFHVGFFGLSGIPLTTQKIEEAPAPVPAPVEQQQEPSPAPAPALATAEKKTEQPVKITGTIEGIEGMTKTPVKQDDVFRFSVKVDTGDIKQIAAFRQIATVLDQLTRSPDPNIKLQPGRPISMLAWDRTATSGSFYPSQVKYLDLPPIVNQPSQKRR